MPGRAALLMVRLLTETAPWLFSSLRRESCGSLDSPLFLKLIFCLFFWGGEENTGKDIDWFELVRSH